MEGETSVPAWPRLNVTWLVALGFVFCMYVPSSKHSGGPEFRIQGFSCSFPASSSSSPWSLCAGEGAEDCRAAWVHLHDLCISCSYKESN